MSSVPLKNLDKTTKSHLAATYAALILHDEGLNINGQKILDLVNAAGVKDFEKFYAKLYASNLNNTIIEQAIATGGQGAASTPVSTSAVQAPNEAKKEDKKPEPKKEEPKKEEEEDYDMGDLFEVEQLKKLTAEQASLNEKCQQFLEKLESKYTELEKDKFSRASIQKLCGETKYENIQKLTQYAHIMYEAGQYESSLRIINCLQNLVNDDNIAQLNIYWGKLSAELILGKFDESKDTIQNIRVKIEDNFMYDKFIYYIMLYMHIFNQNQMKIQNFLASIQMVSSNMIRYIICALLLSRNAENNLSYFLSQVQKEIFDYKDDLVKFTRLLLVDFQFKQAEEVLKTLEQTINNDYFLSFHKNQIVIAAQHLFFKTYCRIFDIVEIKMVSSFLNCSIEDAEMWIVNFIRNSSIQAKIDSETGVVKIIPQTSLLQNNLKRLITQK
ncbi:hypothetical protein IMG5_143300 [Ichthyophthirius multifiliis]|uniref:PCI domain-containing protein n=1 Tax=Ichthyophthirius multifiliis TaxID=5932 RepID=G0QXJ2_ICHMU|nr:hypothetical protein IMG5_143300 [Ichthyophthirius multifiliis]EGR30058.1 hypothetical protein IMG5_143300 [Ichthyophthirius multifiliis]|eukprot:XP_004031294.1 hypothetical protein IMG5_143300 [Ichthyophthirius multifiliis]